MKRIVSRPAALARIALASMRGQLRRLVATTLAVVLGVAFIAGTLIFGDTARAAYDDAFARVAKNVDVAVVAATASVVGERSEPAARLSERQLEAVRRVSGVVAAHGRVVEHVALLDRQGRPMTNFGRVGVAVSTDGDAGLLPYNLVGRTPGPGEAMLDTDTAARLGYVIGETITVVDRANVRHSYRLVGLIDYGLSRQFSGQTAVGLPAREIATLTGTAGYDEIVVKGDEGIAPASLASAVRVALGDGPRVLTGDERRRDKASGAASWTDSFSVLLLLFGAVSVLVAAFVIGNTYAVLTALRVRQTALLRCVGATRRQIFGSVLTEAAIVGLVGGALGVALGIGVAYGLLALINGAMDVAIPAHTPVLTSAPVYAGLIVGVVVTMVAALLPAVRATRTSPLAALRDLPTAPIGSGRRRGVRIALATLAAALGVGLTWLGYGTADDEAGAAIIVGGGVVTFLAVLMLAPLFIGPLTSAIGALPSRMLGPTARLATANARRNPGRAAVTTATLMIGVGLMSVFGVLMSSITVTAATRINEQYPIDYVITAVHYGGERTNLPAGYTAALGAQQEFSAIGRVRVAAVTVNGKTVRLGAVDPAALGTLITPAVTTGSLAELAPGTAIVASSRSVLGDTAIGTAVTAHGAASNTQLRVVAAAPTLLPGTGDVDLLVVWSDLVALAGDQGDAAVVAKVAPGVSAAASRIALDALTDAYPLVQVGGLADLTSDMQAIVDGLLALVAGLLATTVVISLFGIANTLSLSALERTRESATIRALGLTRAQLGATMLLEALFMAVVGALVGLSFGTVYGWVLAAKAFNAARPVIDVPWAGFVGIVALSATAAVIAAVLPARRAAKASIVAAMADT